MLDEVYEYFIDHKVMRLESTVDKEWLAHAILAYPGRTTLLVDFMCDIDAEYIFDEPGCSRYRVSRSYKTPLLIPYGTIIVKAGKDYAYFNWEDFKEYANKMKLILREENEMEKEVKEVVDNMVEETMKKMCYLMQRLVYAVIENRITVLQRTTSKLSQTFGMLT